LTLFFECSEIAYSSGHNFIDTEDEIPPSLPLPKGGIPLFGKEGLGEILESMSG
jgi:hypothetical protein